MSVTPEFFLSLSLFYLQETIADSKTFRAIVEAPNTDWDSLKTLIDAGTSSRVNALAKIISGSADQENNAHNRPRAVIRHPDEISFDRVSTTGYDLSGMLQILFEFPIPEVYQEAEFQDAYTDFTNKVGGIIFDMQKVVAEQPSVPHLNIDEFQQGVLGQVPPEEVNNEQIMLCEYMVSFAGGN